MTDKELMSERLRTLLSDKDLLRQRQGLNTYRAYAEASADEERGGRFAALSKPQIVGASPVAYPRLPTDNAFACDPVGPEPLIDATDCGPRLGYRIDAQHSAAEGSSPPEAADMTEAPEKPAAASVTHSPAKLRRL